MVARRRAGARPRQADPAVVITIPGEWLRGRGRRYIRWDNGGSGRQLAPDAGGPDRGTTEKRTTSPWSGIDAHRIRCRETHLVTDYDIWVCVPDNTATYLQFVQEVLPEYLEEVPLDAREAMWFQQDGAPPRVSPFRFAGTSTCTSRTSG
ncbi:hypothetical protein PR048_028515 [Dryococelus australis]|uniref:Uncharacterized protein n=1 Tax=Dryococelus australis TaxID=614101 RepID=A0ABQ9GAT3_9NEOP|nr:hypothetical protein PR048_028515 [Dryococelus australis]